MCGPIAVMLPVDRNNQTKKVTQILTYHLGRIVAYASIGFAFGLLGKGFFMAGIQQQLSIFIGIMMIVIVVVPTRLFSKYNFSKPIFTIISKLKTALGSQFKNKSYQSLFTIGLLNGFLPCGMVYVALFGAIAMQSPIYGSFYMILFGLGTVPLMSAVVYTNAFLSIPIRNKIQKTIPYVVAVIGILFVLRGFGLNIPFVSPSEINLAVKAAPNCY